MRAARAIGFVFLTVLGVAQTHAQPGETIALVGAITSPVYTPSGCATLSA